MLQSPPIVANAKIRNKMQKLAMTHYNIDYVQKIREQGYRMTPQRQIVLDTVCEQGGHATASEIYDSVNAQQPVINRATVYRISGLFLRSPVGCQSRNWRANRVRNHGRFPAPSPDLSPMWPCGFAARLSFYGAGGPFTG
jgi:hypothetical protein